MAAVAGCDLFLSTLSLRRATQAVAVPVCQHTNFYPRSPCGERPLEAYTLTTMGIFLSTLSLRRATYRFLGAVPSFCISIHALLAESDLHCKTPITFRHYFYPRSPCGERRAPIPLLPFRWYFYPRSPCGERPVAEEAVIPPHKFLSTLSLRRATIDMQLQLCRTKLFLSTLSLRRATMPLRSRLKRVIISIHALLAESDSKQGRHYIGCKIFLSTLSLRRATKTSLTLPCPLPFLSTLSLRRATTFNFHLAPLCTDFYPRSPCGERPELWTFLPLRAKFLSTLSLRRATALIHSKHS